MSRVAQSLLGALLLAVASVLAQRQALELVPRLDRHVAGPIGRAVVKDDHLIHVAGQAGQEWHLVVVREAIFKGIAVPWKVAKQYPDVVDDTGYTEAIAEERAWRDEFRARGGKELFDE
jgi:hypothetical protein